MKQASEEELFEFLRDIDSKLDGEDLKSKITLYEGSSGLLRG